MPANTEQLNYVINFVTEYKNKGLEQARADLGRFQAQAREALGVKAFHRGSTVQTASTSYMGYQPSGRYGYITKATAEGQVSAQIGKSYEASLANIQKNFASGSMTVGSYRKALTNLQLTYQKSVLDVNKLDKSHGSLLATQSKLAMRAIAVIPIWMALRSVFMGLINGISGSVKFLIEFETAMAQIRIVGKGTEEEYKNLGSSLLTMSKMFGVSATEALNAAKIFAQQGLTINETINMTRNSMIASVILGKSIVEVSEDLTAATKAYNLHISSSLSIVDKWQAVQKEFAVTSKDLAEATKTAGASASALGISYDKFLGHVTAIIEVTRKTGSQAANALQMIYSRLLTVAKETIQITAKVPIYQTATGKAVMETTHIFRSASDVIDDLALSWDTLNESQKITLATQVGSRRQLTPFIALMQNYKKAISAEITSLKSSGEAYRDFQIMQNTTTIKMKQMQSSWISLVNTIGDTTPFKNAIDMLKGLADGISYFVDKNQSLINQEKERLTEALLLKQARENELISLQKLIELRDKYNKKLQEAPETQKEQINKFLSQINTAIGGKTFDPLDLQGAIKSRISEEVRLDFTKESNDLANIEIKLMNLRKTVGKDSWLVALSKYNKEEAPKEIENLEKIRDKIESRFNKEIESRLAVIGLSEKELELITKAEEIQKKAEEDIKERTTLLNHQAKMLSLNGYTEEQILKWKIEQYKTDELLQSSEKSRYEQLKLVYELQEKIAEKIKEQSDLLESAATSTFKDILSGKDGNVFTSIVNAMGESFRTTIAESMGKFLVRDTGLGEFFGETMQGLKGQIENGHKVVYDLIKRGHVDGLNVTKGGVAARIAGWSGTSSTIKGQPMFQSTVGSLGQTAFYNPDTGTVTPNTSGGFWGNLLSGKNQTANSMMAGGMLGYSAYSSARSSGSNQRGAIGQGLMGVGALGAMGALSSFGAGFGGYMATNAAMAASMGGAAAGLGGGSLMGGIGAGLAAIGPVGWIALAAVAAGLALTMFSSGGEKTSTESRTSTNTISSKINVTNKQLELVNRNLIALRTDIRTYILPSSSYFSAKSSLDEEFSISSRMASVE
jgi:TP901 family phage tail tape measure protein